MEMRGLMGGFYRISEWIMRLSAINLLWIICSLPFVILVFAQFTMPTEQADAVYQSLYDLIAAFLIPILIAPFTFFPATAAMFSVARKWATGDADVPLFKSFFRNYKSNYKHAMFGGLFFSLGFVLVLFNVQFYSDQQSGLFVLHYLFLILLALSVAAVINFFCYLAHFDMKFWALIKNSLLFTIARPLNSFNLLMINFAVLYVSLFQFTFLIPFFMGSISAMVSFWAFYRSVQRLQEKSEKLKARMEKEEEEPKSAN